MFKTYDSDIDGITNKLGFSKRSFAEWGEQVSSAFTESEGKMNKFKNTLSAVFVPQKDNSQLIGDFQVFKDLMLETGLSAEELAKEVGGVDNRIVSYAKSGEAGKLSTDGFKESIGNLSLGAKAGQVALKGLALVGNALGMAFASWVATEIISWLNDLAHAEENARKRSEELTSSYEDEKKNIDDCIAKYKELSEKLNDSSLSTSEVKSIKEQLLSVQDQLNEKYGAEATQIDLVNGKYDEQIKKLDKLAKKKASDYIAENYNDIKADQKYVSEKFNVNKSLGFKGSQSKPDDYSNSGFDLKKYLDRYDKLDAKVISPDGQYGMTGDVNLITSGTRQEVYDQITALFKDLSDDFGNSNEGVNAFKSTLNDILKSSFDTNELAAANDRIKKYAQAEILSNDDASASYNNLVDAVDNYNTALSSGEGADAAKQKLLKTKQAAEDSTKNIINSGKVLQDVYNSLDSEAPIELQVEFGKNVDEDLQQSYEDTINRFKSSEESSLDELKQSYQDAIDKRKELYSGENYVGNVDINNRPVVINDDGSYSTTSTAFQEKWVGDEENGHYIIAHFTPILPDGTVLDEETLNNYIDRILNSDDPMEADKVENGGYGILYKVDTEINGQEINDDNLEDAFGIADAWDVDMHNLQDKMYASEAEIKSQIENFEGGIDGSQTIKDFFDIEGINTQSLINEFNEVTDGITDADEAIQKWNEHKKDGGITSSNFDDPTDMLRDLTDKDRQDTTTNLADLKNEADIIKEIQSKLEETGNIGVDSMKKITKQYPEANKALSDYMQGIISEQELFSQLETIYENDKNQYIQSVVDKSQTDEEFFNAVMTNYPELYNELQTLYGDDVDNWSNMEKAKLEITNKAIKELAGVWSDYFKVVQDANGKLMVQTTGWYDAGMYSADPDEVEAMDEEYNNMYNHFQSIVDGANAAIDALDNYSYKQVSSSINLDWKGLGKDSSSSSSGRDSSSSDKSQTKQNFNWVEPLLSKISKAYDRLKNKVADTTRTWLNRNNALSDSMEKLLEEINAQSNAYDFYMDKFNSYDLSDYYKDQIANGSFNIETIYDDDLKDAISDCQDLYDKAQDAADSVQSLNIELRQLAKSRFDNIQSQFEEVLGKVNSIKDLYSKDNDLLEEQGWFASTLLNSSMIEQEQKNLAKLEQERDALTKALNSAMESGKIEAESEDWYSMQSAIDDCTSSIYDAKKALVEYDNAIRQINWDAFDRTRNDVSNLIDETQFLVDLLKDEDITDDNGNMNDNGKAAQALIAQKYQLYLNQAKAYKDEILKINEEIANDPYDKELLDRKQELIKAQQEAINSSISEKEALKDLVQEGYDTFLDKLDEVIQKYKDLMSQQKDAYDYEKSIAEKTKALNALEKQYSAVQGDNSEEGKKNIQQLKDQINTAKDDLKDTEYEKLLSDTEKILDQLQSDVKSWLDQRIDEFDVTMQEIIDQSNENATNISETITSTAENYGYKLSESMSSIWSTNASNITNGINSVLGDFSNKFVEGNNAINSVCNSINSAVQGLLANSNAEAQRVADEIAKQQAEQNANTDGGYSDGGGSSGSGDDWSDNWDNSDSGSSDDGGSDGVDWIYEEDSYPKDLLNIENSIVDRLKYNSIASNFGARAGYYEQITGDSDYYGTADQNILLLDYLKSHGLKKGSKSAPGGLTLTDEQGLGSEVIFSKKYGTLRKLDAGDMVFNADQVEKLWNLSKGMPNMFVDNLGAKLPDIPNISNNLANKVDVSYGDVTLTFPNVHNYEDIMKQMQKDPKAEKMIQEMTFGQTLGRNSLSKLTFR